MVEFGKHLLQKVISTKRDDFTSNRTLMHVASMENNVEETRLYAINLVNANYKTYPEMAASKTSFPIVNIYLNNTIDIYQKLTNFFCKRR